MPDSTPNKPASPLIRLNKAIADSGYCARRKADELISAGKVQVNGSTVTEMGTKVNPKTDTITILGKPLPKPETLYLLFHKPTGYVTSRMAGRSQKSIYELLPKEFHSVDPAGRLDQDSSGALILSNDGDFLFRITHPKFHLPKRYEIRLNDLLKPEDIKKLQTGIKLTPENKMARITDITANPSRELCYQVELITGYNRQIRRSMAALGYRVKSLHRISFGPIKLGKLAMGSLRPLTESEKRNLLEGSSMP